MVSPDIWIVAAPDFRRGCCWLRHGAGNSDFRDCGAVRGFRNGWPALTGS